MEQEASIHSRKAVATARIGAEIERHRMGVGTAPIGPGILVVENVEFLRRITLEHGQKRRSRLGDFRCASTISASASNAAPPFSRVDMRCDRKNSSAARSTNDPPSLKGIA